MEDYRAAKLDLDLNRTMLDQTGPGLELKCCLQLVPGAPGDPVFLLPEPEISNSQEMSLTLSLRNNRIMLGLLHHLFQGDVSLP